MVFKDNQHKEFYNDCIVKAQAHNDPYRKALFYALGLTNETRRNISSLYDFNERGILLNGLNNGWQTSTSLRVTRMAFNLYNGFAGDIGDGNDQYAGLYTPYHLFDTSLLPFLFEAVKLRYPEYYRNITPLKQEDEWEGEYE
jgi:hypothetical protein